jgi:hypothetical protein
VPGSTQGELSTPPSNTLQQFDATGNVQLPWSTTLTLVRRSAPLNKTPASFPSARCLDPRVPEPGSLDGDVHLSHYALGLASRPLPKLSIRGNATYDGRDDKTNPLAIAYIVTDTFPGGTAVTPRYSEDRVRLDGGADYALARWLRVGVGGKLDEIHYGPGQSRHLDPKCRKLGSRDHHAHCALELHTEIRQCLRKASSFDQPHCRLSENPLIAQYNYAGRDRVFSSLTGAWSATSTLTWSIEGSLAKDDYRSSPLGLQSTHEDRASSTLTWTPRETLSAYIDAGYERLFNLQNGFTGLGTSPWLAADTDRFWNVGFGGRWIPQERWTLTVDYLLAPSYDNTDNTAGGLQQAFPQSWTKLESTRVGVIYKWTNAAQIHFQYTREHYNSSDWALNGVGPDTVPNLLALGVQPYRDSVNVFGLTVRYQFGRDDAPAKKSP